MVTATSLCANVDAARIATILGSAGRLEPSYDAGRCEVSGPSENSGTLFVIASQLPDNPAFFCDEGWLPVEGLAQGSVCDSEILGPYAVVDIAHGQLFIRANAPDGELTVEQMETLPRESDRLASLIVSG